jgi:hypothetical protein
LDGPKRNLQRHLERFRRGRGDRLRSRGGKRIFDELDRLAGQIGKSRGEAGTLEHFDRAS